MQYVRSASRRTMTGLRLPGEGTGKRTIDRSFSELDYYDRSCYCQVMNADSTKKNTVHGDEPHPSKGQASRSTILLTAAKLATTKGLDGLSIGDLAAEVG